ncbi:MAG: hypothetical protein ACLQGU_17740 [bacterium]
MKGFGYLRPADIQIPTMGCCSGEELLPPLQTVLTGRFFIFSLDFVGDHTIAVPLFDFYRMPAHHQSFPSDCIAREIFTHK